MFFQIFSSLIVLLLNFIDSYQFYSLSFMFFTINHDNIAMNYLLFIQLS